ncbi:hypothetical protein DW1_2416 [Proteiniborus sp. DW1]|nr:hypothetical protein DW1_2416 [Proteiniborus sp. DW1]
MVRVVRKKLKMMRGNNREMIFTKAAEKQYFIGNYRNK